MIETRKAFAATNLANTVVGLEVSMEPNTILRPMKLEAKTMKPIENRSREDLPENLYAFNA